MKQYILFIVLASSTCMLLSLDKGDSQTELHQQNTDHNEYEINAQIEAYEDNSYTITASLISTLVILSSIILIIEYIRRNIYMNSETATQLNKQYKQLIQLIQNVALNSFHSLQTKDSQKFFSTLPYSAVQRCPFLYMCVQCLDRGLEYCPFLQQNPGWYTYIYETCPFRDYNANK